MHSITFAIYECGNGGGGSGSGCVLLIFYVHSIPVRVNQIYNRQTEERKKVYMRRRSDRPDRSLFLISRTISLNTSVAAGVNWGRDEGGRDVKGCEGISTIS